MNMMITELYDAPVSAGAEEVKARDAARVLAELDLSSRDQFSALREDNQAMRTEMAALNGSLREDMQSLNGSLREDMQGLNGSLREDMQGLRSELHSETQSLRGEFKGEATSLRSELKGDLASLRTELTTFKWMFGVLVGVAVAVGLRVFFA